MRQLALLALIFAFVGVTTLPAQAEPGLGEKAVLTPAQIFERFGRSVALILGVVNGQQVIQGTGFIVSPDGLIVTNYHVLRGAYPARVQLADGAVFDDIRVANWEKERDLVIVQLASRGLPSVPLADSSSAHVGQHVVVIGNPAGLGQTVSDGLLSGIRDMSGVTLFQISAPISGGSSGSPVFNDFGEVVGVACSSLQEGQNLNFCIPVNHVKDLLRVNKNVSLREFAELSGSYSAYKGTAFGKALPLVGADIDGNTISLAELNAADKFVMLDFWASWCGPCMGELPLVAPFYDEFASSRFELIGISLDSDATEQKMHEVIADMGLHYPIIYEGGGWQARLAEDWGIRSIPATFLVNPDGVIVLKNIRGEEGLALVKKIVEELPEYLPPPVRLELTASDYAVVAHADVSKLRITKHDFAFSAAGYSRSEGEGGEGSWLGGDYELTLIPSKEGYDLSLSASQPEDANSRVIAKIVDEKVMITLLTKRPITTGYFAMSMFEPQLNATVELGSMYVVPPQPEAEDGGAEAS